ncbi:MAG: TonB-dependent receptor [Pseudomonadota bacterium]
MTHFIVFGAESLQRLQSTSGRWPILEATLKHSQAILVVAATALSGATAQAQDAPFELGTLVLSGGLTPIEADAYGRSSTTITAQEIEDRGIKTVQDALRAVPGVAVNSTGGNFTQVRIRGGEGNHTLILIDGIEAAGGDGEYILSGLETANIERIEVLRGPQSVFYGSNASAGVVNIITRKGNIGQEYSGSIEGGGATTVTGFISTRSERGGISLSYSDARDEGWDFSGDGGEKDGTDRRTLILNGDYMLTPDLQLGFTLRRSEEDYDYDSTSFTATTPEEYIFDDPSRVSTRDELTAGIFAELSTFDGRLTHRLSLEKTENDQSFDGGAPTTTTTDAIKYRLSYALDGRAVSEAKQIVNLLLEHEEDASSSNPLFGREATSIAMEYRGSFNNGLDLQAGLRRDFNDPFDDATTWNVGLSYTLDNGVRLHGSAGTGVVNPSYFELFADAFGFTGNPNLDPERNRSFDIGVELPVLGGRGFVDVTYFDETLTDEIASFSTGPGTFSYENQTGDSTREGLELTASVAATDRLDLRASYTYLDAKNPDGSVEIRRPKHELSIGATLRAFNDRATFSADVRHVSGNADTQFFGAFQTIDLPDITVVDLSARYAINDNVDLTGRVTNLFDNDATESWGYAGRPRTFYVGLAARF